MATNKDLRYFKELEQEIEQQRVLIKNKYKDFNPGKDHPNYDNGFSDGTLAGLKLARSLWYKNFPSFDGGDET